jgi:hypothetical protein
LVEVSQAEDIHIRHERSPFPPSAIEPNPPLVP